MSYTLNKAVVPFVILLIVCVASACNQKKEVVTTNKLDTTTEKAIEDGIQEAKKTLQKDFLQVFEEKDDKNYNYSVKMVFRSFTEEEHIWLDNLRYDNSNALIGFVANQPKKLTHIKAGEQQKVVFEDIVDWMYLRDDVLHGGYTIRALQTGMSDKEKTAFEEKLGFKIED